LKSKEYHELAIMEVFKNMKVQQYFLKVPSYYITSHDPFSIAKKHGHHYCKWGPGWLLFVKKSSILVNKL